MLKKLVKYGNSQALVLDRTLLALLDLEEGGVVKLRVEGDTLVVKAQAEVKATDLLPLELENLTGGEGVAHPTWDPVHLATRRFCKEVAKDPEAQAQLQAWLPGSDNAKKLEDAFREIGKRYEDVRQTLEGKAFLKELDKLNKRYHERTHTPEYVDELLALRLKHAPRAAAMDAELQQAAIDLGCPGRA